MNGIGYRYPRVTRAILRADLAFHGGPEPGAPSPDIDLPTVDGGLLRKRDFVGRRPLLLTCASITCPMAATMGPDLRRLHAEFGDQVAFALLYVREAHPGERYPQPATFDQKLAHARAYQDRNRFPWPVAVDDIDGTIHRALDARPNAAYLLDVEGNVAFRALAANDEQVLREGLQALTGGRPVSIGEREPRVVPALKAVGVMRGVLALAGAEARRDIQRELPGLYPLLRLAALFRPFPPLGRGIAAVAIAGFGLATVLAAMAWLFTRRRGPGEHPVAPASAAGWRRTVILLEQAL